MNPGSRGSVEEQVGAVEVDEAGTQLMWFRVSPVEGPVGQGWACGRWGEGVGASGKVVVGAGVTRLSMSLWGWYRSGM